LFSSRDSFLKSEEKSLLRFLSLYILMGVIVILLLSIFYYQSQDKLSLSNHKIYLSAYANNTIRKLKRLHHFFDETQLYPRDKRFKSAIYDVEYRLIFSLLKESKIDFESDIYRIGDSIHYIKILDNYYLGAKYLIIEIDDNKQWENETIKHIIIYSSITLIVLILFGLYLSKLFLKPMRDSIILLDSFIKDTTHELNTPLSAILANIEMMDRDIMTEKNKKKLHRIDIAAKTVSILYNDLTYLTLSQEQYSQNIDLNIKELIEDRVDYFDILAKSKEILFILKLENIIFYIDKQKAIRVIDNLISNSIKYNKRGGTISIELKSNLLLISDTGIGIAEDKIPYMFNRYKRFNKSEGGFGIGLNIVKKIVNEYNISITVKSKLKEGTTITLQW